MVFVKENKVHIVYEYLGSVACTLFLLYTYARHTFDILEAM